MSSSFGIGYPQALSRVAHTATDGHEQTHRTQPPTVTRLGALKINMESVLTFRPIALTAVFLLLAPGTASANYDPEHCKFVAGSLNLHWEGVAGTTCSGIEFTDGTVEDAVDGSISMSGVSTSEGCLGTAAYAFTLSNDGRTLTGSDTVNNVEMILTRQPGEGCFHGHAIFGDDDYVAHIAGDVFAAAAPPICGDVNDSGGVNTSDALLVLRKAVDQPVVLPCSRYGNTLDDCSFALLTTTADLMACLAAPVCGDGVVGDGEDCDGGGFGDETCVTQGFAGGTLACAAGCTFDTSGCYATRFDTSGDTIIDHETGLEWEKKTTTAGSGANYADPHDVDNVYTWTAGTTAATGTAFTDFLDKLNGQAGAGTGFAGHYDWRLPTVAELESIVELTATGCGSGSPCIASSFGPTQSDRYWSSTTYQNFPSHAWYGNFLFGLTDGFFKTDGYFVRAVRSGSSPDDSITRCRPGRALRR